jgi:hypothetical protein
MAAITTDILRWPTPTSAYGMKSYQFATAERVLTHPSTSK